ncbi:MAG: histone deacetylase family protein [Myxococcota bacterium]
MADTLLLFDDRMVDHDPGMGHPERPDRLRTLWTSLREDPVPGTRWVTPRPAQRAPLVRVHAESYVDAIDRLDGRSRRLDPDTIVSPATVAAAHLAAGATLDAVEAVIDGEADGAFALVRPPGHHAEHARAMGFCLFNNVAVAAEQALREHGCERVLIVDWDVHHGNGTQHIFEHRRDVLYFSVHRHPFYPGSGGVTEVGTGAGEGYSVNVPFRGPARGADFLRAFREVLVPVAAEYRPDLVLVSAGFDAHQRDPLGGMRVTDEGYAALCGVVREIAQEHADGRVALALEGGYDLRGLRESVRACLQILRGDTPPEPRTTTPQGDADVQRAVEVLRRYWSL